MDTSGLMPYDSRPTSAAPFQRAPMAPHFMMANPYTMAPVPTTMPAPHFPAQQSFGFGTYPATTPPPPATATDTAVPQSYRTCHQDRSPVHDSPGRPGPAAYAKDPRQVYMEEHSPSPSVKSENAPSSHGSSQSSPHIASKTITANEAATAAAEISFHTHLDTLMKCIQSKGPDAEKSADLGAANYPSPPHQELAKAEEMSRASTPGDAEGRNDNPERPKPYRCTIKNCNKRFHQRTHLDIHKRAHTGEKPYVCRLPKCGERFSQLGNLKTHERRHTGERPYTCDICGKAFAQRGNVKAHKETHNNVKRFQCKLDGCTKRFTQLGNMKSHQNKFHAATLQDLTTRFISLKGDDDLTQDDREMFEYFALLYKNSNKGIKGRGKHRKVGPIPPSPPSSVNVPSHFPVQQPSPIHPLVHHGLPHPMPHPATVDQYSVPRGGPGHSVMVGRDPRAIYNVYDQDPMGSGPNSAVYDDDHGRDLTFSDRMY